MDTLQAYMLMESLQNALVVIDLQAAEITELRSSLQREAERHENEEAQFQRHNRHLALVRGVLDVESF